MLWVAMRGRLAACNIMNCRASRLGYVRGAGYRFVAPDIVSFTGIGLSRTPLSLLCAMSAQTLPKSLGSCCDSLIKSEEQVCIESFDP